MIESNYLLRYLSFVIGSGFRQSTQDFLLFAKNKIEPSVSPFKFNYADYEIRFPNFPGLVSTDKLPSSFEDLLEISRTRAFIIIKDDKIVCEKYFNGSRESIFQVFSITKSVASMLIGISISEGYIGGIDDPIKKYLPEFSNNSLGKITISNLLQMHSGIRFKEGFSPLKEMVISYLYPRGRKLINKMRLEDEVGKFFHYNDYHLVLLTVVLERVLNKSITEYFEEKIWKPIDSEFPAYLCLDNSRNGLEKLESGLVCTPIDLAKFGRLLLNKGKLNGRQLVLPQWIEDSIDFTSSDRSKEYFSYYDNKSWGNWFKTGKAAYKNFWWGYKVDENYFDYFAMGILGQILYISPRSNAIGIRIGDEWGIKGWWPTVLKEIVYSL